MPSMPTYHVSKGTQFGFLDQQFGPGADLESRYDAALNRLHDSVAGAAAWHVPNQLNTNDVNHFITHWLGDWWPDLAVSDTLRAGFIEALEHARDVAHKPMEVLWICAADRAFHVYYCEGPSRVSVLLFTPPPARHTTDPLDHPENIWVVKLRDQFDLDYPQLGSPGTIPDPVEVAAVVSGPMVGRPIIKQRLHYA
jgi:hypothetical protein